eukprot:16120-Heterococcus_DN1.PRE.2
MTQIVTECVAVFHIIYTEKAALTRLVALQRSTRAIFHNKQLRTTALRLKVIDCLQFELTYQEIRAAAIHSALHLPYDDL